MKLLLYCAKSKPYFYKDLLNRYFTSNKLKVIDFSKIECDISNLIINGKIVAECDFEVERIKLEEYDDYNYSIYSKTYYETKTLQEDDLCKQSCLTADELDNYLYGDSGYVIHIKNLHIFDEPRKLNFYMNKDSTKFIKKAPQNMQVVIDGTYNGMYYNNNKYILISIRPEWLCKILNGKKTVEVRRKVLKEMLK